MTFISFAQNYEDVMLWRALGQVKDGFYVDVGAWSPDDDSVTRAFYDVGWRGINIEPNPMWFDKLREKRPEDKNLSVALSDKEELINLHVAIDETGLSTAQADYAEQNKKDGHLIQVISCQAITLNRLWNENIGKKQVHFLKIDVEGSEAAVLMGNDWTKNRPWIVLIESMYPNTQIPNHHLWEHFLVGSDYVYAYSDGLNRFYVAKEHSELLTSFSYPPNVFDQFKLAAHARAEEDLTVLSQQYQNLSQQYQNLSQQYQAIKVQHSSAVRILMELRKTRIYKFVQYLHQWKWMENDILALEHFNSEVNT